jgi:hypothetical protein
VVVTLSVADVDTAMFAVGPSLTSKIIVLPLAHECPKATSRVNTVPVLIEPAGIFTAACDAPVDVALVSSDFAAVNVL